MKIRLILFLAWPLLLLVSVSAQNGTARLSTITNKEVLEMVKAGVPPDIIIAKIKASRCDFDTTPDALIDLKNRGADNKVILAVIDARAKPNSIPADSASTVEPEYGGVFFIKKGDRLTGLERKTPQIKGKSNIFTSSAKGYFYMEGGRSGVRFNSGETAVFIIRVGSRDRDPMSQIRLLRLEAHDNSRTITVAKASTEFWGSKISVSPLASLSFDAEKYGISSFKITLNRGLPPGEYAFDSIDSQGLFCFGYDKP